MFNLNVYINRWAYSRTPYINCVTVAYFISTAHVIGLKKDYHLFGFDVDAILLATLSRTMFPFNVYATAEASDYKFCTQLGFAKAHHKIKPRGKSWRGPGLREFPKILGFPFNISATTKVSDFKIGRLVGFANAHHKIQPRRKRGRSPVLGELPKISGFSL